jgi:hypothetical protein
VDGEFDEMFDIYTSQPEYEEDIHKQYEDDHKLVNEIMNGGAGKNKRKNVKTMNPPAKSPSKTRRSSRSSSDQIGHEQRDMIRHFTCS